MTTITENLEKELDDYLVVTFYDKHVVKEHICLDFDNGGDVVVLTKEVFLKLLEFAHQIGWVAP